MSSYILYVPGQISISSQIQVSSYIHPTQHTTPQKNILGVVITHVSEPYSITVWATNQYSGPYMCVYVTSLPSIFPNSPHNFLSLEMFSIVIYSHGLTCLVLSPDNFPHPVL